MRILLCHPGAVFSTHDVYAGLLSALKAQGHEVITYGLTNELIAAEVGLEALYNLAMKNGKDVDKPTQADVFYRAGMGMLERCFRQFKGIREPIDFVLIVSGMYTHPDTIISLVNAGIKVGMIYTESPYQDEFQTRVGKYCDWAFTNEKTSVEVLQEAGYDDPFSRTRRVFYLPHAFDAENHKPVNVVYDDVPQHDVVFVGTFFKERIDLLEGVDWTGIDLGLYGTTDLMDDDSPLRQYIVDGTVPNEQTHKLYHNSKIGLNIYRTSVDYNKFSPTIEGAESVNPRVLELAASGTFFLSDDREEHREIFGSTLPSFSNSSELEKLIRYYLSHEQERKVIARSLPSLVLGRSFDAMAKRVIASSSAVLSEMEELNGALSR